MPELSQWKRLVDDRRQRTEQVVSDLRTQGTQAASHVSGAVDALVAGSRRRNEELRQILGGELRRPLSVLSAATQRVGAAREFATEYVSAAVKLDAFGATRGALHEEIRVEVERQLSERSVATANDLRALERRLKRSPSKSSRSRGDEASTRASQGESGAVRARKTASIPQGSPQMVATRPL